MKSRVVMTFRDDVHVEDPEEDTEEAQRQVEELWNADFAFGRGY